MCAADAKAEELYQWVLRWLAYPIQHPGAKMKTAIVMHGPQGTGKNMFFEAVMQIYGRYGWVIDQSAIEDKFNDWASRKLFLIADEVVARSEMFHIKNKLKSFVTGEQIRINPKNMAAYWEANHVNLVFLSNERMATPAAVRFLSVEPMLGPISFEGMFANPTRVNDGTNALEALDWIIVGGESGPRARPMHPEWARDLRDQCAAAGVPFLFKQWGEWTPGENVAKRIGVVQSATWFDGKWLIGTEDLAIEDGHIDDEPDLFRIGKKAAGRLLDGRTHDAFPKGGA